MESMEESRRALEELFSLLNEELLQEPHIVGLCGHTVCRRCIGRRDACGVCGSPTTQRELKPDPQISSVLTCAEKLGQLLSSSRLSETAPGGDGLQEAAQSEAVERSSSTGASTRKVAERRNRLGETPLQVAAIKGDAARVKALLSGGANPNVRDNAGWTPLHEASSQGAVEVVRLLLAAGASVNAAGPDGVTPLHDAVLSNVPDVVLQLCSAGADINARTNDGRTPVSFAQSELMRAALLVTSCSRGASAIWTTSGVEDCLQHGRRIDEALHEAQGVRQHPNNKAPQRARLSGGGTLFSGYSVVLQGPFTRGPSREELATLLTLAGARLLSRVPPSGDCAQAVLVVTDSMTASRTHAATYVEPTWLLDCISRFEFNLPSSS
ncbi:hypothetical protein HPB50_006086 [Hyalomma asiaticum]|uniref:Uncharacterized protein n=1 Tax=Hyalomma asiaticum TaxID=266040 RepID=A0ACB7SVQ5_HYAAI|nr:hypothetical protein HPB50_006086 [Hyalomma asiaticum]